MADDEVEEAGAAPPAAGPPEGTPLPPLAE